jgi:hypothetical protein
MLGRLRPRRNRNSGVVPNLVIGPNLRYVGDTCATIWVETDGACDVEVLGRRERTFCVEGHHYAIVTVEGLEPGTTTAYEVTLDGESVWPEAGTDLPPSTIRTLDPGRVTRLVFGSCRVSLPQTPPYTSRRHLIGSGRNLDALYAYGRRMLRQREAEWPDALLLLGDQVYADEVSTDTAEFIKGRRGPGGPPADEVADFEEYTHLYRDAWSEPVLRWMMSTIQTAMIFDDHDVHDDWNTSLAWVRKMRSKDWWDERIVGGLMSYWLYQHLGNLSPPELATNDLLAAIKAADDGGPLLRAYAFKADREAAGLRWSYDRDFGRTRLIVIDSRCGRVLDGERAMVDDDEFDWITERASGDVDHLLLASSVPYLLLPALHHVEAWNEAVCDGRYGKIGARIGELLRQGADLEHWAAFGASFERLTALIAAVGSGQRGGPPASIVALSGDVHHAYLAEVAFPDAAGVRSRVFQAVCSPVRNPLVPLVRRLYRAAASSRAARLTERLARAAGVPRQPIDWQLTRGPSFDNQIASLDIDGRDLTLRLERAVADDPEHPDLELLFSEALGG